MYTLAAYFHDLNPTVVNLGPISIKWYGVSYIAAFAIAFVALTYLARKGRIMLAPQHIADAMLWLIFGTLLGGRLGYALFYDEQFRLLTTFSGDFPFWKFFAINHGGMASHGGMVGLVLACWRISRGFKDERGVIVGRCSMLHVMDCVAFVCTPGLFLGRLANFVNAELLGAFVRTPGQDPANAPWWAVQFPQELNLPDKVLAQRPEDWQAINTLARNAAPGRSPDDQISLLVANASAFKDQLRPLISARHPSQIYQAIAEGLVLGLLLLVIWAKPRTTGVVAAAFLIGYGVLRILTELVRLPDPQLVVGRIAGLSRGQWLSVAMILVGTGLLVFVLKKRLPKAGGWRG